MTTDSHPARRSTFAALHDPAFARYCAAYIPSMSGTWIRITAMGYLVYKLTGDPAKLGLLSLATSLPQLVLGPVSAGFIDRVNRRTVLVTAQILTISLMAFMAWMIHTSEITFSHMVIIAIALGACLTFDAPVRISLISALVPRELLTNAIAINSSMFNLARVIGPTLAGWFIALVGTTWAFGTTALMMVPFPLVLLTMSRLRAMQVDPPKVSTSALAQLREGLAYIRATPQIHGLLLMSVIPNVLAANYLTLTPAYVSDVLHRDAATLGFLMAVDGIGAFIGTFSVAYFHGMRRRGQRITLALLALGVLLIVFSLAPSLWVAYVSIFLLGVCWGHVVALNDTLIQMLVDERFRGRVMSVFVMIISLGPACALLVGLIAKMTGISQALALTGVATLVYLPFIWLRTTVRTID